MNLPTDFVIDLALENVQAKGYVGDYDFHDNVFGNEYISLVTRDGDPEFSDFRNWIIQALFSRRTETGWNVIP